MNYRKPHKFEPSEEQDPIGRGKLCKCGLPESIPVMHIVKRKSLNKENEMKKIQTVEWEKKFDENWNSFDGYAIYGKDGQMVIDENGNHFAAMKKFIKLLLAQAQQEAVERIEKLIYIDATSEYNQGLLDAIDTLKSKEEA
jgi:hypothetical protein